MEPESLKIVFAVLSGVLAIAAFMHTSITELRGEIRNLAAQQREDYERLSDKINKINIQSRA